MEETDNYTTQYLFSPIDGNWQEYMSQLRDEMLSNFYEQQEKSKMNTYENIYYDFNDTAFGGKLKPITCQKCRDNGMNWCGECDECRANREYNKNYIETHSFIYDTAYQGYHEGYHDRFKSLFLRLPNEHPFLYYGIEIEVEFNNHIVSIYNRDDYDYDEDNDNWEIQEILNKFSKITDGMFVYEQDGSLDNGVECISRPTSYAYWTHPDTVEKLRKGLEFLREKGAYVNQPDSNGLHIHLSRKFFDSGRTNLDNRDTAYESFDWLFQKFQPEIERLGGRKYTHYCASKVDKIRESITDNYLVRHYNLETEMKCKLKKGGQLPQGDHYSSVNLTNKTIEARVFKSTTDYKEVLSYIEMVRNMAHTVRDEDIKRTFNDILHTKDNLYLDEHIAKVQRQARKDNADFDMDRVCDDDIEIVIKQGQQ